MLSIFRGRNTSLNVGSQREPDPAQVGINSRIWMEEIRLLAQQKGSQMEKWGRWVIKYEV